MGVITVKDLKVRGIIGTHPWERKHQQDIIINLCIAYDSTKACQSDKLINALNYELLVNEVVKLVGKSKYLLLEKLTAKVLELLMSYPLVLEASVRIEKPQAIAEAASVCFELVGRKK